MKKFRRALRLVGHHPRLLVTSVICSLAVAVLWGGNIGALYPIVEVTLKGQSLQHWTSDQIHSAETKVAELEGEIAELEQKQATADQASKQSYDRELSIARHRLVAERKAADFAHRAQPLVNRYLPEQPFQTVLLIVVVLMLATAVKDFFLVGSLMSTERLMQRVTFDLRVRFYDHVLAMDLKTMHKTGTARLMRYFDKEVSSIGSGVRGVIGGAIREPLKMIACGIGAAMINWRLFLLMFVLAPLATFAIRTIARKIRYSSDKEMSQSMQLNRLVFDSFNGLQTVQSHTMESSERARLHDACKTRMRRALTIAFYKSLTKPATEILGIAAVGLILIVGAYLVLNQETHMFGVRFCDRPMSIGSLLMFYALLVGMSDPARKLSEVYTGVQRAVAASDRFFKLLDRKAEIVDPTSPTPLPKLHNQIELSGVSFHYASKKPVLRDVSLTIPFGETLAIVGANGSGKSTLSRLIPRFLDPIGGSVCIDGIDLRKVSLGDLRRRIGIVTQQHFLFDDTVANNIRYGAPDAADEEVVKAAKLARAHSFIVEQLADGYETVVGQDGNRLSGGQRQRIALARAMLRNPEILILDEFTSQVDVEGEKLIHQALKEFVRQRTTIIVTHRTSTLALADRIVVMDGGQITDVGRHEELLGRCKLYQHLQHQELKRAA